MSGGKGTQQWMRKFIRTIWQRPNVTESVVVGGLSASVMLVYHYVLDKHGSVRRYYLNHPTGKHAYQILMFSLVIVSAGVMFSIRFIMSECIQLCTKMMMASLKTRDNK